MTTSPMDISPLPGDVREWLLTGLTEVTASHVVNSSGTPITNATVYFQPCDWHGNWVAYQINGAAQAMWQSVSTQVVNGAFNILLPDTSLTTPQNLYFQVRIFDNVSGADLLGPNYFIQPTGANWNFDTFVPISPTLPLVLGVPAFDVFLITSPTVANTPFTLTRPLAAANLLGLYYNGVLLLPTTHYSLNGQNVIPTFPMFSNDNLYASYLSLTP